MTERLVIIGGVAAGAKAAAKARRTNPKLDISVYQEEADISYSACGQPYVISGLIGQRKQLVIRTPDDFLKDDIQVMTRCRVTALNTSEKKLTVIDLTSGKDSFVRYDKLIIATGARPILPAIKGLELEGVLTLRSMSDLDRLIRYIEVMKPKNAAIIGAGYIGLELADSFRNLGIATSVVEKAERILPKFDPEIAQRVYDHCVAHEIEFVLGDSLAKLNGTGGQVSALETESGRSIACGLVVLAIGVRPNIDLAKQSGIGLGATGAIAVNNRMETRIQGVYAAGDCCETTDRITGNPIWMPLGDIANLQGRVAGENAAGGCAEFPGVFGTAIFKSFDLNVAITGLSEQSALQARLNPISVIISAWDRARYYPGGRELDIKLIASKDSGRILGAQVIGTGSADKMIDIAATALLGKLTCEDLENADLAYSPPFSQVLSPIITAAGALNSKIKKARA